MGNEPGTGPRDRRGRPSSGASGGERPGRARTDAVLQALPPLTRVGPYRLVRRLGSGGMGSVYLAHDEALGRDAAVKVVSPHRLLRPGALRRFRREARAGANVHHPNVIRTLGAGSEIVDGETWHYLVMEYRPGRSLREVLAEDGPLPDARVRGVGRQVAAGLSAIHAAGLVHRDVKPENLLVDADGVVRIADLGVARVVDTAVTLDGRFTGSLLYASPEQLLGRTPLPSADLFALGVSLYELAAGRHPLCEPGAQPEIDGLIHPRPPALGDARPGVTPFLEAVVHGLLEIDPAARPPCAADVERILREGESGRWWLERRDAWL